MMETTLSITAFIVALSSFILALRRHKYTKKSLMRPVLVFGRKDDGYWHLMNVGNGSAINIFVCDGTENKTWDSHVLCNPMVKDESIPLKWLLHANDLVVNYTDCDGRKYHTRCGSYQNKNADNHVHIDKEKSFVFYRENQPPKFPPNKYLDDQT